VEVQVQVGIDMGSLDQNRLPILWMVKVVKIFGTMPMYRLMIELRLHLCLHLHSRLLDSGIIISNTFSNTTITIRTSNLLRYIRSFFWVIRCVSLQIDIDSSHLIIKTRHLDVAPAVVLVVVQMLILS
jgi:hypothetical protein